VNIGYIWSILPVSKYVFSSYSYRLWVLWCEGVHSSSDVQYNIKLIWHYLLRDAKSLDIHKVCVCLCNFILQYDFVVSNYVIYRLHAIHMIRLKMGNKSLEGVNGKDIPVQAWTFPEGSRSLRIRGFLDKWSMMATRLSAYTPAALTTRRYSLYPFLLETESIPGP
jgi:hypothetical protein